VPEAKREVIKGCAVTGQLVAKAGARSAPARVVKTEGRGLMPKIVLCMAICLDGVIAGQDDGPEFPFDVPEGRDNP
jgi:hypothetical protein